MKPCGNGGKIRIRNNLISGFWPGSPSPGRDTRAGGCLTATGILSNKVCDSDQLCSIPLGVGLNWVSWGQNTSSLLRKSDTIIDTSLTMSRFIARTLHMAWGEAGPPVLIVVRMSIDLFCCSGGKQPQQFYPCAFSHEMKADLILSSETVVTPHQPIPDTAI